MANLRDVRLRMRAIEQTLQVTKAMNLISTAKLRKGRRMLLDTEPYFKRIQKSMFDIISSAGDIPSVFFQKPDPSNTSRTAIIVVTSDKGLAGGYNANVFRLVNDLCSRVQNPLLILIGSVGYRYFIHSPYVILENFSFHSQIPTVEHAGEITDYIISQYLWGMFNEIHVVYTHMFSAIKLTPVEKQIVPLVKEKIQNDL
jgi:F-type H+-transporting ATPase subunit gamma